jgi:hypothetical protein
LTSDVQTQLKVLMTPDSWLVALMRSATSASGFGNAIGLRP